jgi:hypothetical protein
MERSKRAQTDINLDSNINKKKSKLDNSLENTNKSVVLNHLFDLDHSSKI